MSLSEEEQRKEKKLRYQIKTFENFSNYGNPTKLIKNFKKIADKDKYIDHTKKWKFIGLIWKEFQNKYNFPGFYEKDFFNFFLGIGAIQIYEKMIGHQGFIGYAPIGKKQWSRWDMHIEVSMASFWEEKVKKLLDKEKIEEFEKKIDKLNIRIERSSNKIKQYKKEGNEDFRKFEYDYRAGLYYTRRKYKIKISKLKE